MDVTLRCPSHIEGEIDACGDEYGSDDSGQRREADGAMVSPLLMSASSVWATIARTRGRSSLIMPVLPFAGQPSATKALS
jgi:hypothetical protein